ncbi:hypothetical protein BGW38_004762 [Lunasporangiospora selenospora]|uniref:Autophagy-related protein 27 n=1 Tax=Lunasporangiospora selenospora TaxID=979761 RepID=A0A9P6FZX6_9FUNG|nr:hypothetical protein BGW38_004762 [Lunasporangiospora selenospora]
MIRLATRRGAFAAFTILASLLATTMAQGETPAFNYENIVIDGHTYNISAFNETAYTVAGQVRTGHPNNYRYDYTLNPCKALAVPEGQDKTHCVAGTWVCQDVKVVYENGTTTTFLLQPIAGSFPAKDGAPARDVAALASRVTTQEDTSQAPWNLTLKGGVIDGQEQSAVITFVCDETATDATVAPTLDSDSGGVARFTWKSSHACPKQIQNPHDEGMSGFGIFMTVLLVFGFLYMSLGAFYNHQKFGARGLDMIPHFEFLKDFPYLVIDVSRHVWDAVTGRSRGNRGGYVSV